MCPSTSVQLKLLSYLLDFTSTPKALHLRLRGTLCNKLYVPNTSHCGTHLTVSVTISISFLCWCRGRTASSTG